ncbi:hypothetical protein GCM10027059_14160 [Myceligenerans halotolerans]
MSVSTGTTNDAAAHDAREAMVDALEVGGRLTSATVLAALRAAPRERFAPAGTPLEQVYDPDRPVITRRQEHGAAVSSVSAPQLQGRMIEQAGIGPGDTVLEIGSGGYNAALIAEVVGDTGSVVSIDIDEWVTDRANEILTATGYADRVTVLTADGDLPVEGHGPFDAIIVTVGAWDIPPVWIDQLAPTGRLVVPLRMRSVTRTVGLRRNGDHLVAESAESGGFVPMQGIGKHDEHALHLPDGTGKHITLRFDETKPADPHLLDGVLASTETYDWSGVLLDGGEDFGGLHLWFASYLDGFCRVHADKGTGLASQMGRTWFPFGTAVGDSFALLAVRKVGDRFEHGARGFGPHAAVAAARLAEQVRAWDENGRPDEAAIGYWPDGADLSAVPADAVVLPKAHGVVTISWPR